MTEFAKVSGYIAEAEKLWATNQELVQSRQFYCLWEDACRPEPFVVPAAGLRLGRQVLAPGAAPGERVAHFTWHDDEHCAALVVEDDDETQLVLLRFG